MVACDFWTELFLLTSSSELGGDGEGWISIGCEEPAGPVTGGVERVTGTCTDDSLGVGDGGLGMGPGMEWVSVCATAVLRGDS